jgi:ElaB/YqjD/DUF883 family membrane-anchored ribosome-binding protein
VELFAGVDDLIRRIANTENPEVRKIRARVYAALTDAKTAFENSTSQSALRQEYLQDYFQEDPVPVLGVALLVGLGLGLVAS